MRNERGFTLIELLIVVAIIGILASIAIPNLLSAIDRGKQKRTMGDMRSIGTAIEAYAIDNNMYPTATDAPTLKGLIELGAYMKNMPINDGWSHQFQVASASTSYTLYSMGKDGIGNTCTQGVTTLFNDEICFVGGQFMRYPEGSQR